jgi:hypothetical protein
LLSCDAGIEAKRGIASPTVNLKDFSTQRVGVGLIAVFGEEAKEKGDWASLSIRRPGLIQGIKCRW